MKYHEIYRHYEDCFVEHGDNHKGMDWPNHFDAQTRYTVMSELIGFYKEEVDTPTLLDFGCGTGHFLDFLRDKGLNVRYAGCDISHLFIEQCRRKYPGEIFFQTDLLDGGTLKGKYDFACMNGVFTERRSLSDDEMWNFSTSLLEAVFKNLRYGLAVNFMTKNVDWEREDLFHLSLDRLTSYVSRNLSRSYIIRSDYGLYDFTLYIYR